MLKTVKKYIVNKNINIKLILVINNYYIMHLNIKYVTKNALKMVNVHKYNIKYKQILNNMYLIPKFNLLIS